LSPICAGRINFRVRAALPIHSVGPRLAVKPVWIFAYAGNQTMIVWQSRGLVTISTEIPETLENWGWIPVVNEDFLPRHYTLTQSGSSPLQVRHPVWSMVSYMYVVILASYCEITVSLNLDVVNFQ